MNMRRALQLILLTTCLHCFAWGAELELTWTAADKILGFTETIKKEKGGITFKAHPQGERYFYSIDGKEGKLIDYNEEFFVPAGSTLKLTARHSSHKIEVIKTDQSIIVLAELKMDLRSFGKGVEILRAATIIDSENKRADLERSKADPLFKGSKFFTPEAPTEATPEAK